MEIKRIYTYEDPRFSQKVLLQHGCFLAEDEPYVVEIISDREAVIRGANRAAFSEVIEELRFYAPHIIRFYDTDQCVVAEYAAVQLLTIPLGQIQPSQFYVDEDKIAAISSFIHEAVDIVIQVLPHEGRYISLDGHTRLYYAVMQGWEHVRAVVEHTDDWVYDFVKEAQKRNVYKPNDLMLVCHSEYEEKWNRFCDEFFAGDLIASWKAEEDIAHIHGWDFSHINDRYAEEEDLPWDYRETILRYLKPEMRILDIDTGGGEFLLSLGHPHKNTSATEAYLPNVELCRETLLPLGIDFRAGDGKERLPFEDEAFDMVINRHGDFNAEEIHRVLKPGGVFITQQVGAENDRELVDLLLTEGIPLPFPEQYLQITEEKFRQAGFEILEGQECFRPIRFYDVGALVWFAHIIEWEFPGFSVDACLDGLMEAQRQVEEKGYVEGRIHRFWLVARKV